MASFWENFAEAMGWGKANHTKHLSDISEEKKQEYRNRYVDSANRSYEKNEHGRPKIENAKQNGGDPLFTREDDDFVGEYNSDNGDYETRVYNFEYLAPTNGEALDSDPYGAKEYRTGKVLLRVPTNEASGHWFNDKEFRGTNIGVYEAVLDDGTVLNADQFKDLVQANPYGEDRRSRQMTFILGDQDFVSAKDKLKSFKNYKNKLVPREYETKWDRNWRGFKSTRPWTQDSPTTYNLYYKPGPNGE